MPIKRPAPPEPTDHRCACGAVLAPGDTHCARCRQLAAVLEETIRPDRPRRLRGLP